MRSSLAAFANVAGKQKSVFIIWIPARLQISSRWVQLNDVWDRVEKGILMLVDLGLNLYFIYIVRAELIDHGLRKYWALYWYNVGMIFVSMSLDVSPPPPPESAILGEGVTDKQARSSSSASCPCRNSPRSCKQPTHLALSLSRQRTHHI